MKNVIDIRQLQAYVDANDALHDALGVARGCPLPLAPFAQGEYNANFAFEAPDAAGAPRPLLLRVNLGSQMHLDNQIEYEMDALRLLEPTGRTPRALYVDGSRSAFPYGVGVEERLPGRPLRYETDMELAAQILADIHALEVPAACHLLRPAHPLAAILEECGQMFSVYRAWPSADAAVVGRIEALFERARRVVEADLCGSVPAPVRLCVANTEVNSSNFLVNSAPGQRSYLVDWEKPILSEPAQDLGHFLVPTTTYWKTTTILSRSQIVGFVDAYIDAVAGRFDTDGLQGRLAGYLAVTCLRGITWCAMAYTEYAGGARAAANADTFEKIREYLGDDMLTLVERDYMEPAREP